MQVGSLLARIENVRRNQEQSIYRKNAAMPARDVDMDDPMHVPVIICGDLNSTPGSDVHNLLRMGRVSARSDAGKRFKTSRFAPLLQHSLPLRSPYAVLNGSEPTFTVVNPKFVGCLDYIFASPQLLPVAVIPVPPSGCNAFTVIPSEANPSDHFPLGASFDIQRIPGPRLAYLCVEEVTADAVLRDGFSCRVRRNVAVHVSAAAALEGYRRRRAVRCAVLEVLDARLTSVWPAFGQCLTSA
jgi:hypothetical protein